MVAERKIYEDEGLEKYVTYQVEHESEPLTPGAAFPFVKVGLRLGLSVWGVVPEMHFSHSKHDVDTGHTWEKFSRKKKPDSCIK